MGRDQTVRRSYPGLKANTQLGTSPASIHVPHHTLTSTTAGSAAELAASRKVTKYADLPATQNFVPIAIESSGPVHTAGLEFIKELGQRMTVATGDPMETVHLFQRLSICTP